MPKVTYVSLVAECGHAYMGYDYDVLRVRCDECMTRMRLNMEADNRHRAHLIAIAPKTYYYIPQSVRREVYERDGDVCQLCFDPVDTDLPANDIWSATLDHIVCRSWTVEPDHSAGNLRLAHRWCNSVRGNEAHYRADVLLPTPAA